MQAVADASTWHIDATGARAVVAGTDIKVSQIASEAAARLRHATAEPLLTRYVVSSLADEHTLDISHARSSLGYNPTVDADDSTLV